MVRTRCPHCQKHYDVPPSVLGRTGRCSSCRKIFTLSGPGTPYPTEDDILQWLIEAGEDLDGPEADEQVAEPAAAAALTESATSAVATA